MQPQGQDYFNGTGRRKRGIARVRLSLGQGLQPALRDLVTAVDALSIAPGLDARQCGEHPFPLPAGRVQDRFGAIGLGQGGSRVGRVLRIPRPGQGRGTLALQDGYRPVQVGAHLLKALTGDGYLHWCPRLPSACTAQSQARVSRGRVPRTQNNSPGGRSWSAGSETMSSGPLFRTELTAVETGCDVRPPAIAGSIVA